MVPTRFILEFKSKVIHFYDSRLNQTDKKENSINYIARITKIYRRYISKWIQQRAKIFEAKFKRTSCRIISEKDASICPPMELQLKQWIIDQRNKGVCISGSEIQKKSGQIFNQIHPTNPPANFVPQCDTNRTDFKA